MVVPGHLGVAGRVRAVTGLTNREVAQRLFVSRRTVETHLEHVFRKLGHGNRVELTADLTRRAVTGPLTPIGPTVPKAARASRRTAPPDHPHG